MILKVRKTIWLAVLVLVVLNSGCYSLRKKFVRKKKYKKEDPVYIELKSYPEPDARAAYTDTLVYLNGWLDDLVRSLEENTGRKHQRRAVERAGECLDKLHMLSLPPKQSQIESLQIRLKAVSDKLNALKIDDPVYCRRLAVEVKLIKRGVPSP